MQQRKGIFMDEISLQIVLFLAAAGFIAAFIDSVAGGGGLISLPAILLTGVPPVVALGTNKIASVMGSCTSTLSFIRSGKVDFGIVKYLFPLSFLGSALGVYTVRLIPSDFLKPMVVVMLIVVTIYSVAKKNWGAASTYAGLTRRKMILAGIATFGMGFYDGFFGPGTGSFMLFAFLCIGFDFVGSAANARALNFASNIAAALLFAYFGLVDYHFAIPMGCGMIAGAFAGTRMAIVKGAGYVRPLFIFMTTVLIGKQIWDLIHS